MSVKFLSEDWLNASNETLAGDADYQAATSTTDLTLQFVVSDTADGDFEYNVTMANGTTTFVAGTLEGADATIRNNLETAMAVSKGDLNTQAAFISGKLKVEANLAKIMLTQSALPALADGLTAMEIDY